MMDPATQLYLQNLIRQEGRSMLQYVGEAFPWTTPANQAFLPHISEMIAAEKHKAEELTRLLLKHRGRPAFLGAYPISFTNINFISLDHLLPRLAKFEKVRIAELEADLNRLLHEETRSRVRELLEMKKRHLARLEELTAQRTPAGAAEVR